METIKNIILGIVIAFAFLALLSFISGLGTIGAERESMNTQDDGICEYKSYASMYNPFYKAGCELFEIRN